jgi:hypothetical protein
MAALYLAAFVSNSRPVREATSVARPKSLFSSSSESRVVLFEIIRAMRSGESAYLRFLAPTESPTSFTHTDYECLCFRPNYRRRNNYHDCVRWQLWERYSIGMVRVD